MVGMELNITTCISATLKTIYWCSALTHIQEAHTCWLNNCFVFYAVSAIFQPCKGGEHTCKSAPSVIPFIRSRILIKMSEHEKIIKFINNNCYLFIKQKNLVTKTILKAFHNRCIDGDSKVYSSHTGKIQHIVLKQSVSTKNNS